MTPTVTELLAQKQQLLGRLQEKQPGLSEQDEIERLNRPGFAGGHLV